LPWIFSMSLLGCKLVNPPPEPPSQNPGQAQLPTVKDSPTLTGDVAKPDLAALEAELLSRYDAAQRPQLTTRLSRGLRQVAALWQPTDGDLAAFAREHFIADDATLLATLARFESMTEQLEGHLLEIGRALKQANETDSGPLLPVDNLFGGYDPGAHVTEDLFKSKLAFVALLNFPQTTLHDRLSSGEQYSRRDWAEARLSGRFARRLPGPVQQRIAETQSAGERYIASYNLWMHHILDERGHRLFPKGLRLISHWNLRDQIRGDYGNAEKGLLRQRTMTRVMERIVEQSLPQAVIDNPRLDWNPWSNEVQPAPKETIEADAPPERPSAVPGGDPSSREPDTRYALLLDIFAAQKLADPYSPSTPTLIARSFELLRELPEERVVNMLREVCGSPLAARVAALVEKRLKRKLLPHDLWYPGFRPKSRHAEPELDRLVAQRYPTAAAFEVDLPNILRKLSFSDEKARFLAEHIRVDASRGAGHAMPAARRGDFPRLRTRVEKSGMNYKGYNIAVHELGHNVEQVFSLYGVDRTLLAGVPNNAFTEALAFVFQHRDLELLGLTGSAQADPQAEALRVINEFFTTWEIAGVALVEIATWHFMYEHPRSTPAELRQAVTGIAREIWNRYYAPLLGGQDALLLGVYSHMIQNTLYLPDYPIGHLIAFQIEEHLRKQPPGSLGREFERMATYGQVTPDLWLKHATGSPLGAAPLLTATEKALKTLGP
jgi:hypothetical protein